jgi:putative ABC transport system substrate-binding protein
MIRRREFITLLGGAATVWPIVARAQQPAIPVVGWLSSGWPDEYAGWISAFRKGLNAAGFVEGKNVTIEYRFEEGQYDRLPVLAAELVRRPATVIIAFGGPRPTNAAKAATSTIPIVFESLTDPVATGLVASLSRPGGNVTGVYVRSNEIGTKQLGLLRELVPAAKAIALLVNPNTPGADFLPKDIEPAARSLGLELRLLNAGTERDLDDALATVGRQRPDALIVQSDAFLTRRRTQIVQTAARYTIPTISSNLDFAAAGGLMSYGANTADATYQTGIYAGRILKGEHPAELPVMQSSKFELVINLQTAKAHGLEVPPMLLTRADEVIE